MQTPPPRTYDVVVIGGGNAALSAALTAREAGATVLVLEHAPRTMRGGNSRHTRNLRAMHTEAHLSPHRGLPRGRILGRPPPRHRRATPTSTLARLTIRLTQEALPVPGTLRRRFQPSLTGTLNLSRTNAFFLGGGKALLNAVYATAERMGVEILYDTEVQKSLELDDGFVRRLVVNCHGFPTEVQARAVIAASAAASRPTSTGSNLPGVPRPRTS